MAILRRKKTDLPDEPIAEAVVDADPRSAGPFDSSEKTTENDPGYVDLGALKIRGRVGFEIRMQADGSSDDVGAAVLVASDAAVEIRAFAASRSGGLWDEVRAELIAEVDRLEGTYEIIEGVFGPELHLRMPAKTESGEEAFQPSRIVVVEGPRWMLRGTFLGQAALEPNDDGLLFQAFRHVIVERGVEAMASRDPLFLTIPQNSIAVDPTADTAPE
jgi:hypothetical protein